MFGVWKFMAILWCQEAMTLRPKYGVYLKESAYARSPDTSARSMRSLSMVKKLPREVWIQVSGYGIPRTGKAEQEISVEHAANPDTENV